MSTTPETLETAADLARRWKVSPSSINRLAMRARDPLPSVTLGCSRRYVPSEVAEWMARQRNGEIRITLKHLTAG